MIIFHIDVNNAFLSWEAVCRLQENPDSIDLRNIPCVVGGSEENRHGIVVAKSTPAKKFGIKTAETLADARKKCPNIQIVPPRHHIYKQFSCELISYLRELTPRVEQYSIDEAFVDISQSSLLSQYTPIQAANHIRQEIFRRFGYTVNVGVSSNKILAKMASDFEKPNKVHSLFPEEVPEKMWPLPVEELFFVGKASAKKLYNLGIRTIGELAQTDKHIIQSHMGKHGMLIHDYANGIDTSPVITEHADAKGYGNSTTLPKDVTDSGEAKKVLFSLCNSVSNRLRADGVLAQVVAVTIKNNTFRQSSHQCTLSTVTNLSEDLHVTACQLFDELWDGTPIRLLGVATSKITKQQEQQISLLNTDFFQRQGKMDEALKEIRKKFGENAVFRASSLGNESE